MTTRYITWKKGSQTQKTAIHPDESTMNPDPDGTKARMLEDGWNPVHVDPIPGLKMKPWRPNHRSYFSDPPEPRGILSLKRPADILSLDVHIYADQIHVVAKVRKAFEPFVMYLHTKHLDWAEQKFWAAARKHGWTSDNTTTMTRYFYADIYNEIHKREPVRVEKVS